MRLPWFIIVVSVSGLAAFFWAWWSDDLLLGLFSSGYTAGVIGGFVEGSEWQRRQSLARAAAAQRRNEDE